MPKSLICGLKIGIIGMGRVGASTAFALMLQHIANEIVLVDRDFKKAEGEAWDLNHGMSFIEDVQVRAGTHADLKGAKFVIMCAGARQQPGESRLELLQRNVEILKNEIPKIIKHTGDTILIIVSNPVDVLTYVAGKLSGLSHEHCFGTGTSLDSSRLRFLLARHFKVSPHSVQAYVIGEHGDSELPVWSEAGINGVKLKDFRGYDKKAIEAAFISTRDAAQQVIARKGATNWAIALTVSAIVKSIANNKKIVAPVSTTLQGQYGLKDVALSLPVVLDKRGAGELLELPLSANEKKQLQNSAKILKDSIKSVGF